MLKEELFEKLDPEYIRWVMVLVPFISGFIGKNIIMIIK